MPNAITGQRHCRDDTDMGMFVPAIISQVFVRLVMTSIAVFLEVRLSWSIIVCERLALLECTLALGSVVGLMLTTRGKADIAISGLEQSVASSVRCCTQGI